MSEPYHHGDLKNALIRAGIDILSSEGIEALSLRSVARRAGVSHAAPYAHFADKQSLVAAIAAEGFAKLYARLAVVQDRQVDPLVRLVDTANAYLHFALDEPAHFRVMFAGVVEAEKNYPEFVEQSQRCFALVVALVADCQAAGLFNGAEPQLAAVSLWSSIHGFIQLYQSNQIPSALTGLYTVHELFHRHLRQSLQLDGLA